jgi:hypothetical protein
LTVLTDLTDSADFTDFIGLTDLGHLTNELQNVCFVEIALACDVASCRVQPRIGTSGGRKRIESARKPSNVCERTNHRTTGWQEKLACSTTSRVAQDRREHLKKLLHRAARDVGLLLFSPHQLGQLGQLKRFCRRP